MLEAMMMFQATAKRINAFTSLSCGWASNGSQKKMTRSILPCAIIAPNCWSPPSGPVMSFSTGSPNSFSIIFPVVPVATNSWFANLSLFFFAHSSSSSFRLSCATSATRLLTSIVLVGIPVMVQIEYHAPLAEMPFSSNGRQRICR